MQSFNAQSIDCVGANSYTIYINFMRVHTNVRNLQIVNILQIATNIYKLNNLSCQHVKNIFYSQFTSSTDPQIEYLMMAA